MNLNSLWVQQGIFFLATWKNNVFGTLQQILMYLFDWQYWQLYWKTNENAFVHYYFLTSLLSLSDPKLATKRQTVTAMLGIDKKAHKPTASILIFTRTGICLASDSEGILIIHHVLFTWSKSCLLSRGFCKRLTSFKESATIRLLLLQCPLSQPRSGATVLVDLSRLYDEHL